MKIIDPTNLTQTTTLTTNHVGTMTKMIMRINMVSEEKHRNRTDQSHQKMNTRNQEMKKMANAKTKKQRNDNKANQKNPNNFRFHKARENNN